MIAPKSIQWQPSYNLAVFPGVFSTFAVQRTVSRRSFASSGVCDMSSPGDSA